MSMNVQLPDHMTVPLTRTATTLWAHTPALVKAGSPEMGKDVKVTTFHPNVYH